MRRTPILRRTPLRRVALAAAAKAGTSKPTKSLQVPQAMRYAVLTRDGHYCARCRISCLNVESSLQHRVPRGMGGTTNPLSITMPNLVRLCGSGTTRCHGHVENEGRDQAYVDGWLVHRYDELETKPLVRTDGSSFYLIGDQLVEA